MKLLNTIVGILTLSLFTSNFANVGSHAYTYSGPDISGEITILGPWLAPEDESFRDVISVLENATGAVVEYGGSDGFAEQQIVIDFQAGSPRYSCVSTIWFCCKYCCYWMPNISYTRCKRFSV